MKIVSLVAENIKKLRAVEITPAGALVQITGANGAGKSSVLDSIWYCLAGTKDIPKQPVRAGEEKAFVKLDLGEIIVTRRFTAAGGTALYVEAADGARYPTPQAMLDKLLGSLTFDPLAFSRMDPRRQLEQLRTLVKLDVDIDALDAANQQDYTARTEVNRSAKSLRAQAAAIVVADGTPPEPIDTGALLQRMETASEHNADIERRKARRLAVAQEAATLRAVAESDQKTAEEHRAEAARLLTQAEKIETDAREASDKADALQAKLDSAPPLPEPVDVASVRAEIEAAQHANAAIASRGRRADIEAQALAAEQRSQALTDAMDKRAADRAAAIAGAAMPIDGLSFGAGEVLYRELPFAQASSAEQLRVSVAIAMAANPTLRVLRIKDGSLLDENGLQMLANMASAADFQIWIEQVDTTGKVGVVMEDGQVRQ